MNTLKKSNYYLVAAILFIAFGFCSIKAQDNPKASATNTQDVPAKVSLPSNETIAPMQIIRRAPVVEVSINGKGPYKFFLDTGAGATVFNQDLADELKLQVKGEIKIGDPANPQAITAKQNWVERIDSRYSRISSKRSQESGRRNRRNPGFDSK